MTGELEFSVAFDIVVSILLGVTIFYAVILNRKLNAMRAAKSEMEALLGRFAEQTAGAERALAALKRHSTEIKGPLESSVEAARALKTDLDFLVGKGNEVADRIEAGVSGARKAKAPAKPAPRGTVDEAPKPQRAQAPRPTPRVASIGDAQERAPAGPSTEPSGEAAEGAGDGGRKAAFLNRLKAIR